MAVRDFSGYTLTPIKEDVSVTEEVTTPNNEEGYLQSIKDIIGGTAGSFAQGIGNVAKMGHEFLTQPQLIERLDKTSTIKPSKTLGETFAPNLTESIEKQVAPIKEKLPSYEGLVDSVFGTARKKSGNIATEALFKTAENGPLLALLGGTSGMDVAADYAGSLGMSLANKLGYGEGAQVGAGVLGSLGLSRMANILKQNPTQRAKYISDKFNKIEELGSKIKVSPETRTKALNELLKTEDELSKKLTGRGAKLSGAEKSEIAENIKSIGQRLENPTLNASELYGIKKDINSLYASKGSEQKYFNGKLQNIASSALEKVSENNPKFGSIYKDADQLWKIKNWTNPLTKFLDKYTPKTKYTKFLEHPLAQLGTGALLQMSGVGGKTSKALLATGALGGVSKAIDVAGREGQFLKHLFESPAGQRLMWNIIGSSAKDSSVAMASSLNKMNKFAEEFDKKFKDINIPSHKGQLRDLSSYRMRPL